MKRLLLSLIAALALPISANAGMDSMIYKPETNDDDGVSIILSRVYSRNKTEGVGKVLVKQYYDEFYDKFECELAFSKPVRLSTTSDPLDLMQMKDTGEWELRIRAKPRGIVSSDKPVKAYKFDDGEIVPLQVGYVYSIPFSRWSNHKEITFNTGTTYYLGSLRRAINLLNNSVFCD